MACCVAVVVWLVRARPGRQVTVAAVVMVLVAMLCAVPGGVLWTFGVDHAVDTGATCPACAVVTYLSAGPLGGYSADADAFAGVLCAQRRGQLAARLSHWTATRSTPTRSRACCVPSGVGSSPPRPRRWPGGCRRTFDAHLLHVGTNQIAFQVLPGATYRNGICIYH